MRFSIIIPVYNTSKYLSACIDSVLTQEFDDYEIILVNDGSTDDSYDICNRYALKNSKIHFISQDNKGISVARNNGVAAASGEYLIFLDSDDYLYNNCLNLLNSEINSQYDVIAFSWKAVPDDQNQSDYISDKLANILQGAYRNGSEYLLDALDKNSNYPWFAWMYAFKRKFWKLNSFEFPVGKAYEDVYLIWRVILKAENVKVIPQTAYIYRTQRVGSIVVTPTLKREQDRLSIIEANINDVHDFENISDKLRSLLIENFSAIYYSSFIFATNIKDKNEYKKLMKLLDDKKYIGKYARSYKFTIIRLIMKIAGVSCVAKLLGLRRFLKYRM